MITRLDFKATCTIGCSRIQTEHGRLWLEYGAGICCCLSCRSWMDGQVSMVEHDITNGPNYLKNEEIQQSISKLNLGMRCQGQVG